MFQVAPNMCMVLCLKTIKYLFLVYQDSWLGKTHTYDQYIRSFIRQHWQNKNQNRILRFLKRILRFLSCQYRCKKNEYTNNTSSSFFRITMLFRRFKVIRMFSGLLLGMYVHIGLLIIMQQYRYQQLEIVIHLPITCIQLSVYCRSYLSFWKFSIFIPDNPCHIYICTIA